ncbi:hypothetical protein CEK25_005807 [Fusarium fujikuroi]|nr:hypothetical protein CEK25_005807 [Fusarium fujikuroi]
MTLQSPTASTNMSHRPPPVYGLAGSSTACHCCARTTDSMDGTGFIMHGTPQHPPQTQLPQPTVSEDLQYQAHYQALEDAGKKTARFWLDDTPGLYNDTPEKYNDRSSVSTLLVSSFLGHHSGPMSLKPEA